MLPESWQNFLGDAGMALLHRALEQAEEAYGKTTVYPPRPELFSAFHLTVPEQVRGVILGQDPYHAPGQAHGLAFSVRKGTSLPPSLRNIFTELERDLSLPWPPCGDLTPWAREGVLLLNATLTVEADKAASHASLGWQDFTDFVVARLALLPQPIAFVLWGAHAGKKAELAASSPYPRLVLRSAHPSPLSAYRGFFGSRPFSQINDFLEKNGEMGINWRL